MKLSKYLSPLFLLVLSLTALNSQVTAAEPGSIKGNVYCDKDKNGICDCEESGLKGIPIQIFVEHCGGIALQTVSTDEKGNFTFEHFDPGTYYVKVDLDYVCGGRVPTTASCKQVDLSAGQTVDLPAFGYSEFGQ